MYLVHVFTPIYLHKYLYAHTHTCTHAQQYKKRIVSQGVVTKKVGTMLSHTHASINLVLSMYVLHGLCEHPPKREA